MRPLIEILEDERTLLQKLESVYQLLIRSEDVELIQIITAKKKNVERDLDLVRIEIREYMGNLLNGGDES